MAFDSQQQAQSQQQQQPLLAPQQPQQVAQQPQQVAQQPIPYSEAQYAAPVGYQYGAAPYNGSANFAPLPSQQQQPQNGNYYPVYQGQYVQPGYVNNYQPAPVIVERHSGSTTSGRDTTGALIIFVCGFFLSCVWLAGCMYFRSREPLARGLGILSVCLFLIGVIVAIIVLSVMLSNTNSYYYYN
ncbi:hypothetical protein CYY_001268 [Polysphondylium violaceum]|uniref:Uncharacterized protein n=1 Tax=Polysphondylium violaceum TaxID=133409 RepID=A0A8J4Q252_9MYCE|nr:hypothetical protein CYY_001268 [Polysphondylium violaceum]